MTLGAASGTLLRMSLKIHRAAPPSNPATSGGGDRRSGSGSAGDVAMGSIPLLVFQSTLAKLQPLVKYTDFAGVPTQYAHAMQVLGPHGIASNIAPSYNADAADTLTRALATAWLYGVVLARNSTVGRLEIAPDIPTSAAVWDDYSPDGQFFASAWLCADAGYIQPLPAPGALFKPHDAILPADWALWISKAFGSRRSGVNGRAGDKTEERTRREGAVTKISRGQAALELYQAATVH